MCHASLLQFAALSWIIPGHVIITFNQLNTMLNSSAVVGVSVPALGTPERDTARIVVLDKVISANLLYLDAKRQGLDQDPAYQRELGDFSNGNDAVIIKGDGELADLAGKPVNLVELSVSHYLLARALREYPSCRLPYTLDSAMMVLEKRRWMNRSSNEMDCASLLGL